MSSFLRLLTLIRPVVGYMAVALFFAWATVLSSAMLMGCAGYLIATAALHPFIYELSLAIVGVRSFGIARAVLRYAERYFSHEATFRIITELRVWFYTKLEPLAPAKLAEWRSGAIFEMITTSIDHLQDFYLRVISPSLTAILVVIALVGSLGWFLPEVAIVLSCFFVLVGIVMPLVVNRYQALPKRAVLEAKNRQKSRLLDGIEGMTELTTANKVEVAIAELDAIDETLGAYQVKESKFTALNHAFVAAMSNFALWCTLILLIEAVSVGKINGVWLTAIFLAVQSSFEVAAVLPAVWQYGKSTFASAEALFAIADHAQPIEKVAEPMAAREPFDLVVEELSFSYLPHAAVLKNISFTVKAGQKVAIVGESGSGKSTLVNLLLRFWEYEGGTIQLGGTDYRKLSQEQIRQCFCAVTQESQLFHATIRENFLLVNPKATEEAMWNALKRAGLAAFVSKLAEGLDFVIGQDGQKLSGGERQRLLLARAFLKTAPIFLLDEPTVNLDAKTATAVLETVWQNAREQSLLYITHQLAGLEKMDEILVLADGRIAEQGTFDELMEKRELFYQLWQYRAY